MVYWLIKVNMTIKKKRNEAFIINELKKIDDFVIINLTTIGKGIPDILIYDKHIDYMMLVEIKSINDKMSLLQIHNQEMLKSSVLKDTKNGFIIDIKMKNKNKEAICKKILCKLNQ